MATRSSIFAWKIPGAEEPGRLPSPWGCKELDITEPRFTRVVFFLRANERLFTMKILFVHKVYSTLPDTFCFIKTTEFVLV